MVERIDKEEGRLRAKDEIERASSELDAAFLLNEKGFYVKSVSSFYETLCRMPRGLPRGSLTAGLPLEILLPTDP